MERTDIGLAERVYALLERNPDMQLGREDIALKFAVPIERVTPLLRAYLRRGHFDLLHIGKGDRVYCLGPTIPESDSFEKLSKIVAVVDFECLPPSRKSKYAPLFAKLLAPGKCLPGYPLSCFKGMKKAVIEQNKKGTPRYTVRVVDGKVNLYRLADAGSPALKRVA